MFWIMSNILRNSVGSNGYHNPAVATLAPLLKQLEPHDPHYSSNAFIKRFRN